MTTERKPIMRKISLLDLAEDVSEANRIMWVPRDTF
jgi:hypothetical protein